MIIDLISNNLIKENEFINISNIFINERNINENNIILIIENEIKYNNYKYFSFKRNENEIIIRIFENKNYNENIEKFFNEKKFSILLYEYDLKLKEIKKILNKYELKEIEYKQLNLKEKN